MDYRFLDDTVQSTTLKNFDICQCFFLSLGDGSFGVISKKLLSQPWDNSFFLRRKTSLSFWEFSSFSSYLYICDHFLWGVGGYWGLNSLALSYIPCPFYFEQDLAKFLRLAFILQSACLSLSGYTWFCACLCDLFWVHFFKKWCDGSTLFFCMWLSSFLGNICWKGCSLPI